MTTDDKYFEYKVENLNKEGTTTFDFCFNIADDNGFREIKCKHCTGIVKQYGTDYFVVPETITVSNNNYESETVCLACLEEAITLYRNQRKNDTTGTYRRA